MTVSQIDVVRAAVELIDHHGLAKLTLRGVATRLGVSAPTLYWHVRNKRHLLDLVAEQVLADYLAADDEDPAQAPSLPDWLTAQARTQRAALLAHRDSAQVVAGNRPTTDALPRIERTLTALVDAGLQPGEALRTLTAIGSYVLGDVLETQTVAQRAAEDDRGTLHERYPVAAAAGREMGDDNDRFEEGLSLLVEGLRSRLTARSAATVR
jgi:TetR/AcrR family transcriptional regulator, tetracycline repressor protein